MTFPAPAHLKLSSLILEMARKNLLFPQQRKPIVKLPAWVSLSIRWQIPQNAQIAIPQDNSLV